MAWNWNTFKINIRAIKFSTYLSYLLADKWIGLFAVVKISKHNLIQIIIHFFFQENTQLNVDALNCCQLGFIKSWQEYTMFNILNK